MPITISGVGVNVTIDIEEGASVADALGAAGFNDTESVDVQVDGAPVEAPEATPAVEGSQVSATPKNAALG
jgi:sulfur carrier protein ThiS